MAQMLTIAGKDCDRMAMAQAGQAIIAAWSPDRFGRALRQAVDLARNAPHKTDPIGRWLAAALLCRRERTDG